LPRSDAGGIGECDVVAEHRAHLDDPEEQEQEEREDERELDQRLSFLSAVSAMEAHGISIGIRALDLHAFMRLRTTSWACCCR
jgi:hypothetical protein